MVTIKSSYTLTFKIRIKLFRLVAAEDVVTNMEFQLILTPSSALPKKKINPFFEQSWKYKSNRLVYQSLELEHLLLISPKNQRLSIAPSCFCTGLLSLERTNYQVFGDLGRPAAARVPHSGFSVSPMISGCCKFITSWCPYPESVHMVNIYC